MASGFTSDKLHFWNLEEKIDSPKSFFFCDFDWQKIKYNSIGETQPLLRWNQIGSASLKFPEKNPQGFFRMKYAVFSSVKKLADFFLPESFLKSQKQNSIPYFQLMDLVLNKIGLKKRRKF